MSVRKEIEQQLTTDWPGIPELAKVRVIATERALDELEQPTALIRSRTIAKAPSAPNSHRNIGLLLTLISPHRDMDMAGDQLDDLAAAALDYLDTRFLHDDAQVVGYGDPDRGGYLAYDIPITVLASKE
jgi:hypothetical protein